MSRFRFVSEFASDYGVKRLCRVLKVERSGSRSGVGWMTSATGNVGPT